jgi:hypothetical protein
MAVQLPNRANPATPKWTFRWKGLDGPLVPKLTAWVVTAAGFGLLYTTVRVEVVPPPGWNETKASLIHLPNGSEGRAWRLRALEGGPSPSRFDPAEWDGALPYQAALLQAMQPPLPPYRPNLLPLPDNSASPRRLSLLRSGEPVFPARHSASPAVPSPTAAVRIVPTLQPLAGITIDHIPIELPEVPELSPETIGMAWEFILRLAPGGEAVEAISLAGPDAPGVMELSTWMRQLRFPRNTPPGEIALRLEFTQTPTDEPHAD